MLGFPYFGAIGAPPHPVATGAQAKGWRPSSMTETTNSAAAKRRSIRNRALLGTAAAILLGGTVLGEAVIIPKTPAYADAVTVDNTAQPPSFADLVEKVRPAVVSVRVKEVARDQAGVDPNMFQFQFPKGSPMERFFKQFRNDQQNQPFQQRQPFSMSLGSGFLISDDGYVVTNDHVVDGGQSVTVIMDDGTEYAADVVGADKKTDLALLKIKNPDKTFAYVKFSNDPVRVGDWVVAVGNPFGLGGSVTAGIVSANDRNIGAGPYDDFIQVDAPVNRGNSGGPDFNLKGEVIGINTAIFSPSGGNVGIAFAIPAHEAEQIIADLKDNGQVVRGWLGVQIQGINRDIADGLQLPDAKGSLVTEAQPDSPAMAAGLKSGDAILAVNGQSVAGPHELASKIADFAPGTTVKITYWRDGANHDVDIKLGTLPGEEQVASAGSQNTPKQTSMLEDFGLAVGPGDKDQGVVVTNVDPNGQAAERGVQPGDVILSVGDSDVTQPGDVEKLVQTAKTDGLKAVLLRIKSGDQTRFIALTFARA
jgi:serine protease Do